MKNLILLLAAIFIGTHLVTAQSKKNQEFSLLTGRLLHSSGHYTESQQREAAAMPCIKDSMVTYYWNSLSSSFFKSNKNVYTYVPSYSVSTDTYYSYGSNSWYISNRLTYSYDLLNRNTQQLREYASGGQPVTWYPSSRSTYTYDNYGYQTQSIYQYYNSQTSSWENSVQYLDSYDAQHNNIQETSQQWKKNSWRNNFQVLTTFNSQNRITASVYQEWDTLTNSWKNILKISSINYGSNGKLSSFTALEWYNNNWVNSSRTGFTYNSSGFQTMQLDEEWTGTSWGNSFRSTYTYDAANNLINQTYEEWDALSAWVIQSKNTFTYDSHNNQISSLHEYLTNNVLTPNSKSEMFYNCTTVGIPSTFENNSFVIAPNPAGNSIKIHTSLSEGKIIVKDLQGRVVLEDLLRDEIQLTGLPQGLYLLQLINPEGVSLSTTRIIKN